MLCVSRIGPWLHWDHSNEEVSFETSSCDLCLKMNYSNNRMRITVVTVVPNLVHVFIPAFIIDSTCMCRAYVLAGFYG